jgi:AraC-binding-like domain
LNRHGLSKTSTPHSVYRTPGLIRRGNPELYRVALAMSGSPLLLQDGRAARLSRGEFTIYDFTRPYELAYDSAVQLAVFSFPHEMLAFPMDIIARLTAVPITADWGTGALTAPLLRRIALDLDGYLPASAARLSTVVMDLVTTAVAERADQAGSLSAESRERTLLLRIHAFIEQHLGDADLAPGMWPLRTSSPFATCTGCSLGRTRRWPRGSGTGASNGAARTWQIRPSMPCR